MEPITVIFKLPGSAHLGGYSYRHSHFQLLSVYQPVEVRDMPYRSHAWDRVFEFACV